MHTWAHKTIRAREALNAGERACSYNNNACSPPQLSSQDVERPSSSPESEREKSSGTTELLGLNVVFPRLVHRMAELRI